MSFLATNASSTGKWIHAPSTDYVFAYLFDNWPQDVVAKITGAFTDALAMSSKIKDAVKATSGQQVVNGLYVLDQEAMTKAMNSITGMGMTAASQHNQSGSGTPSAIVNAFFQSVLAGLGGDVSPMSTYLHQKMADQQTTAEGVTSTTLGTVIGLVSLMPVLNVPVTTFTYAFITGESKTWFTKVRCHDPQQHQSYDYNYTAVNYNYVKA
jgi:hypothetical protein